MTSLLDVGPGPIQKKLQSSRIYLGPLEFHFHFTFLCVNGGASKWLDSCQSHVNFEVEIGKTCESDGIQLPTELYMEKIVSHSNTWFSEHVQ